MNKQICLIVLLSHFSFSFTMRTEPIQRIQLPSQKVLTQRFLVLGYHDFLTFSELHIQLGDRKITPEAFVSYIISSLNDYNEYKKNSCAIKPIVLSQELILSTILKDQPTVIESLKKQNLLS